MCKDINFVNSSDARKALNNYAYHHSGRVALSNTFSRFEPSRAMRQMEWGPVFVFDVFTKIILAPSGEKRGNKSSYRKSSALK